ncbi:replication initiator [Streptomyces sp. NPDC127066]|uniref:replication initiator n=1 Tax=Streptomyces sp. NPDC127066 TaxID=3347125 RepID=UPI003651C92B
MAGLLARPARAVRVAGCREGSSRGASCRSPARGAPARRAAARPVPGWSASGMRGGGRAPPRYPPRRPRPASGTALSPDSYPYEAAALWNAHARALWRRFSIRLRRDSRQARRSSPNALPRPRPRLTAPGRLRLPSTTTPRMAKTRGWAATWSEATSFSA